MDLENPFFRVDGYDLFGYLAPGSMVLFSAIVSSVQVVFNVSLKQALIDMVCFTKDLNIEQFIFLSILFVILSYIIGHLTGSLSSSIFEKTIIGKILGYPYRSLILKEERLEDYSSWSYRAFATIFLVFCFLFVSGVTEPVMTLNFISIGLYAPLYCQVASFLIILFLLKICDDPVVRNNKNGEKNLYRKLMFFVFRCVGLPFYILERFNYHFQGQIKVLPDEIIVRIKERYKQIFKLDLKESAKTEIFWSIYWYVVNTNPMMRARFGKWLVLYGFMRNMSVAALATSFIIVTPARITGIESNFEYFLSIALLLFAIVFSFRYYYLYFDYYSKNIFRAFAYGEAFENKIQKLMAGQVRSQS